MQALCSLSICSAATRQSLRNTPPSQPEHLTPLSDTTNEWETGLFAMEEGMYGPYNAIVSKQKWTELNRNR